MNINTLSYLVAGAMGGTVLVLTDNLWYIIGVAAYGTVMNILGFAEGLKQGRK